MNRQECYFGLSEELERVCQTIPLQPVHVLQRYPYTLIAYSSLPPIDARDFVMANLVSDFSKHDFEQYLFGMDYYASSVVLTWSKSRMEELKDSHYAVYMWVRKEFSRNRVEKDAFHRQAFNHGLMQIARMVQLNKKDKMEVRPILKRFGWTEKNYRV